eukprot:TRINITY_DN3724_c1_g1_i3.p1 TRINITY_DN3724_c1_g1~~TRINITY_DN3724_c1_g1_i3.p1  ORF type:complete len:982 (+),score=144.33 TRINITY_DN3724_c1_g1_i3:348-3293(+)
MVPRCIVQALRAVAEAIHTDPFAKPALETLSEIAARNPKLVAVCGGMKTIFNAAIDPYFADMQDPLLATLLYIFDDTSTRQYVRPSTDICILFSPLSDISTSPPNEIDDRSKIWEASVKAISVMLKSWTGLITLASDPLLLKSMVDTLFLPSWALRGIIIDGLFGIFKMPIPKDTNWFAKHGESVSPDGLDLPSRTYDERPNLMNNFLSALLLVFIECGLVEALVTVGETQAEGADTFVIHKATVLLAEMLHMSSSLLSVTQCAKIQTLPSLVSTAVTFALHDQERVGASHMVANLHHLAHLKSRTQQGQPQGSLTVTGANKWRRIKGRDKRLDKVDDIKKKMDFSIDEKQLLVKLQQTQVTENKDFRRWAWDSISEMLEGPLRNPMHVATVMRQTKFFKRLLSFLRPSRRLFSTLPLSQEHMTYAMVGCQTLEILLESEQGTVFIAESLFLKQLSEILKEEADMLEHPSTSRTSVSRFLDENSILKTMSKEYFSLIGTMSSFNRGADMLRNLKVFVYLRTLVETPGRLDLASLIITSLDYTDADHARVLFAKALYCQTMAARYFATRHLRTLLRAGAPDFASWGIDYLAKQLSDSDAKVWGTAVAILDEACDDPECMESLITKAPPLVTLGKAGFDLWLRFLSTDTGFKHLMSVSFVEPELEKWRNIENVLYAAHLEAVLEEAFGSRVSSATKRVVPIPPHLYGELTKTAAGRALFLEKKILEGLVEDMMNINQLPIKRRAALWALGNIGSSESGLEILEKEAVIEKIVRLAETDPWLSLRGTCFNVIAMISRTEKGRQRLDTFQWQTPNTPKPHTCVPLDLKRCSLFKVADYAYGGSVAGDEALPCDLELSTQPASSDHATLITQIGNLANNVLLEKATRTIKRLKTQKPELFLSPQLAQDVLVLLEHQPFRLAIRRFLFALLPETAFSTPQFWSLFPATTPSEVIMMTSGGVTDRTTITPASNSKNAFTLRTSNKTNK